MRRARVPTARPLAVLVAAALGVAAAPATAQFALSAGFEVQSGRYGKPVSTEEVRVPLRAAWSAQRWRLQADLPLLTRVEGVASALSREEADEEEEEGGIAPPLAAPATVRRQSGAGDLTLSAWYALRPASAAQTGVSAGVRIKAPVADASRCLLTNGATDLSVEARLARPLGVIDASATLGWTLRGDPLRRDAQCRPTGGRTDLRDPLYLALGAEVPVTRRVALSAEYEYRQRLRAAADPKSEVTVAAVFGRGGARQVSAYVITGFTDASPDFGAGVRVRWRF